MYIFASSFSYALAEKSRSFITTVICGYDIVPRMTVRGLGHLLFSVKDLIDHSDDTVQSVLCCIECRKPKINPDEIEERQTSAILNLKIKRPGTCTGESENDSKIVTTDGENSKHTKVQFGRHLLQQLAKLVTTEAGNSARREESKSSEEDEEQAMMFTPGCIIHLEVEKVDTLKM